MEGICETSLFLHFFLCLPEFSVWKELKKNFTCTKSYFNASLCTLDKNCPSDFRVHPT